MWNKIKYIYCKFHVANWFSQNGVVGFCQLHVCSQLLVTVEEYV